MHYLCYQTKQAFIPMQNGFAMLLEKILKEEIAFDAGKTTFRHEKYSEYKGGRQKTPPELSEQFPYIRQLLDVYHIKRYELDNYKGIWEEF